jgi:predicted thioredoxin/glutaredoxin
VTRGQLVGGDAPQVTLYTRPGCHLCDVAAVQLRALQSSVRFRLASVSIEGDEELERRYLLEIPVVAVDGEVVTQAPVDLEAVRAAVVAATRAH